MIWRPSGQTPRIAYAMSTEEGHAVQKDQVLHLHGHVLLLVHDHFMLPFQHVRPVQDELEVERLGVVRNRYVLMGPSSRFS